MTDDLAFVLPGQIAAFVAESNRIEGILRKPTAAEIDAHKSFLGLSEIKLNHLCNLVGVIAPGKLLRCAPGMNVRVGAHFPMPGGQGIVSALSALLAEGVRFGRAYDVHRDYEKLHPFMDGNGRSGRALWLWMMLRDGSDSYVLSRGFLHTWYYQSLAAQKGNQ